MKLIFKIWRGDTTGGKLVDYHVEATEGMVVLDVVHKIQAEQANDLACRWNCKARQVRLLLRRNQRRPAPHVQ